MTVVALGRRRCRHGYLVQPPPRRGRPACRRRCSPARRQPGARYLVRRSRRTAAQRGGAPMPETRWSRRLQNSQMSADEGACRAGVVDGDAPVGLRRPHHRRSADTERDVLDLTAARHDLQCLPSGSGSFSSNTRAAQAEAFCSSVTTPEISLKGLVYWLASWKMLSWPMVMPLGYGIDRAHEADACIDDVVDEAGGRVSHAGRRWLSGSRPAGGHSPRQKPRGSGPRGRRACTTFWPSSSRY